MSLQQKMHYKELTPSDTVEKLTEQLKSMGIEVEEEWVTTSTAGTYSLRLMIKGTQLGSNGKGVTKEFAQASAYAEFFERYQNNWLARCHMLWKSKHNFNYYVDEIKMNSEEIAEQDNAFINMYFNSRGLGNATNEEKAAAFRKIQKLDYKLFAEKDSYVTLPFYSILNKQVVYLPYNAYSFYYCSNGMCAGNSPEEALCQGFSEIFERVVQKKIILERPALPDIPEEFIAKFPQIEEMFKKLKSNSKEYTYLLKDCSFGGKYPVAALVVIEKNTGRYGIKLGCHPDFGLAMERAFTEAAQGNDIPEYVDRSVLDFANERITDDFNILNSFKSGKAQFPYELLLDSSSNQFVPVKDVSAMTNKEILDYMISDILNDGYDVLIRNVSYMGIPSFHIIIPGLSEVINMTDIRYEAYNTKFHVAQLLNTPEYITKENCNYVLGVLDYFANSLLENSMRYHYGVLTNLQLPAEDVGLGWLYLSAMCLVLRGEYQSAALRMKILMSKIVNKNAENVKFYRLVYYYLSGMSSVCNHMSVISYLRLFFDDSLCDKLDDIFVNPEKVIVKQYPRHDFLDWANCKRMQCCDYYKYAECIEKFKEIQISNPISQDMLINLFEYLEVVAV